MGSCTGLVAVNMPINFLVPWAHNAKIVGFGTGSLTGERAAALLRSRIVCESMGSLHFSYYEPRLCLEKSRVN